MDSGIKNICLTAERLGNALDFEDLNTDVIVSLDNGDEYIATFFSFKNLQGMIEEHRHSKEFLTRRCYKTLNAVLVNDFKYENLRPVIERMIVEGDFQVMFKKLE
jgi:hypothetical protein